MYFFDIFINFTSYNSFLCIHTFVWRHSPQRDAVGAWGTETMCTCTIFSWQINFS